MRCGKGTERRSRRGQGPPSAWGYSSTAASETETETETERERETETETETETERDRETETLIETAVRRAAYTRQTVSV